MYIIFLKTLILVLLSDSALPQKTFVGDCIWASTDDECPDHGYMGVYLYTKKNPNDPKRVYFKANYDDFTSTNFNPHNENKIIVHGFNSDMYLNVLQSIKQEYMASDRELNVWMVNYPRLSSPELCYAAAAHNTAHVGLCLRFFIGRLRLYNPSTKIHVIGFSLGAHVGNYISLRAPGGKVDRITGLDPAGPGFSLLTLNSVKLDSSDAHFVDVVHTNMGIQGTTEDGGDVNFYMNKGVTQPGCSGTVADGLNCHHRRAATYFAESINTKVGFWGYNCWSYFTYITGICSAGSDILEMGEHCPTWGHGSYFANTNDNSPYALGKHF